MPANGCFWVKLHTHTLLSCYSVTYTHKNKKILFSKKGTNRILKPDKKIQLKEEKYQKMFFFQVKKLKEK